jgi:hypothetical protein
VRFCHVEARLGKRTREWVPPEVSSEKLGETVVSAAAKKKNASALGGEPTPVPSDAGGERTPPSTNPDVSSRRGCV